MLLNRLKSTINRAVVAVITRHNSRKGVCAIEIRSCVGLGARLEWCLEILAYCDEHGLTPYFRFSYPKSDNSEDYFSAFFELEGRARNGKPPTFVKISSITELSLGKDYDRTLNVALANRLIDKYLIVKRDVLSEVEKFCSKHFENKRVLGVHYRGTDKVEESSEISYESVAKNIKHYLQLYPDTDIVFIASDDMNFVEDIATTSVGRPIVYRDDSFRARDGKSIHKSAATDKYQINRDAIVNCLLLSRCDALLKTASILSGWSKLFNPKLPVVVLNRPYEVWFPERELIQNNFFEPLQ